MPRVYQPKYYNGLSYEDVITYYSKNVYLSREDAEKEILKFGFIKTDEDNKYLFETPPAGGWDTRDIRPDVNLYKGTFAFISVLELQDTYDEFKIEVDND